MKLSAVPDGHFLQGLQLIAFLDAAGPQQHFNHWIKQYIRAHSHQYSEENTGQSPTCTWPSGPPTDSALGCYRYWITPVPAEDNNICFSPFSVWSSIGKFQSLRDEHRACMTYKLLIILNLSNQYFQIVISVLFNHRISMTKLRKCLL